MYGKKREENLFMRERQAKKQRKEQPAEQVKKPADKGLVIFNAIILVLIVAVLALGGYAVVSNYIANKPEEPINTVEDYVKQNDMTVDEFLAAYGLEGSEVTAETDIGNACSAMTLEKFAEFSDTTIDEIKTTYGLTDDVTPDMTWADAQGYVTVGTAVEMSGMTYEDYLSGFSLTEEQLPKDMLMKDAEPVLQQAYEAMMAAQATDEPAADAEQTPEAASDAD